MARRQTIRTEEDTPPAGYVRAQDVDLASWYSSKIILSDRGEAFAYLGFIPPDVQSLETFFSLSVAKRRNTSISEHRFIRLHRGTLQMDSFLHPWGFFRIADAAVLRLPAGADSYFGVTFCSHGGEDEGLSRQIFGCTFNDLQQTLDAYSRVFHHDRYQYQNYPRITFSKSRSNNCDLTGAFIPQNFPYIAFTDSGFYRSHVSLHGFYRHLAILCERVAEKGEPIRNKTFSALIAAGVNQHALNLIIGYDTVANAEPLRDFV